jgi:hypothetical protein
MSLILDGTNGETFPTWTTGTRPASPNTAQVGYNTTTPGLEVYTGSAWSAVGGSGGLGGQQVFTSSGTFTIPTGKTVVKVTIIGAGGGSGGANYGSCSATLLGGSGGGGGAAVKYLTSLTPGNTLTVTVGTGGTAGASGATSSNNATSGGTGVTSSVASGTQTITTVSATGGAGGGANNSGNLLGSAKASGGTGSNGDYNLTGNYSFFPNGSSTTNTLSGASALGFSPSNLNWENGSTAVAAIAGSNYGGGAVGPGIWNAAAAGAAGAGGIVIFEY